MNQREEKDEHLENLWYLKEKESTSFEDLKKKMDTIFNEKIVDELVAQGFADLSEDRTSISLTEAGEAHARRLIRAHRLAERLINDVLGGSFESGACEFEHMMNQEVLDSVCTLLGHPRECPHGLPIPKGECCKNALQTMDSPVVSLKNLQVGQSARVAYVNCNSDQQLHKIDSFQIRPGAWIKVHQVYPTYVIECEGASIAMDETIADDIKVWKEPEHCDTCCQGKKKKRRRGWRSFSFRNHKNRDS